MTVAAVTRRFLHSQITHFLPAFLASRTPSRHILETVSRFDLRDFSFISQPSPYKTAHTWSKLIGDAISPPSFSEHPPVRAHLPTLHFGVASCSRSSRRLGPATLARGRQTVKGGPFLDEPFPRAPWRAGALALLLPISVYGGPVLLRGRSIVKLRGLDGLDGTCVHRKVLGGDGLRVEEEETRCACPVQTVVDGANRRGRWDCCRTGSRRRGSGSICRGYRRRFP